MANKKPESYVAQWPLELDGQRYEPGEQIALDDAVAAPLLELGVLASPGSAEAEQG